MSFEPRTRLQKILMGVAATPRTALEHAVKYAVDKSAAELPSVTNSDNGDVLTVVSGKWAKATPVDNAFYDIPITVTESQGTISATTTANFADVKAAVAANKHVRAVVTFPDSAGILYAPFNYKDADTPTTIVFASALDLGIETDSPAIYVFRLTSDGVTAKNVALTVST